MIKYVNKRNQTYYLHQGVTKTGKARYYFSLKKENALSEIPDGYEIGENSRSLVFLRKTREKLITDDELNVVEQGMRKFTKLEYFRTDVKKNIIIVFTPDQTIENMTVLLKNVAAKQGKEIKDVLNDIVTYSPMFQFVLIDKKRRTFMAQRYCFSGSIDDWIDIGRSDKLVNLVKKYLPHLEQDSYFDLY